MQAKSITFRGDDGGFADRFQHAPALQQGHHGAQHYQQRAALGAVRAMPQLHQPLKHQQHQQHQVHQRQQSRPVLGMHRDASASERGVFPRPHRVVAPHDSNDDDGETSSASEDSALSGGYPSPPHAGARPPASFGKRAEPSSSFGLETFTVSKRSRTQQQSGWSAAASESAGGGGGGGGNARQLPRMAALESFQQQARDQHLHHHQEHQRQQQQQQQQHRRQSSVGSHASASSRMAAPMQLPPLSVARATPSTTSSPATSPGLRATSPPAAGSLRLQQHVQQHHAQHHPQRHPHARHPHHAQHHHAAHPRQAPRHHHHAHPIHDHPPHLQVETLHHAELPAPGGTARVLAQPWLPRDVEGARQIPRIEALRASAPAPAACRWDPVWSKTTQGQTGNFNHVGILGGYPEGAATNGRAWLGAGIAREQGSAGGWPLHHEGDFQPRRPHPFEREDKQHPHQHTLRQQEVKALHRAEIAGSPRTPSPIFHHQPSLSRSSSAATSTASGTPHDRTGKPAWTSAIQDDREWTHSTANHEPDGAGKQILERYLANLNPKASREVWSHDEEEVLWRAQREYGNAWNYISGLLPGRSENAVKNHWYTQMRMFIGQRGNHSTNSKPCPPPPSDGIVKAASPKECRQPKPFNTHEEDKPDARVDAKSCAASVDTDADTPAPESAGGGHDARVENEARAEAVAALGMLFAQREETAPSVGGEKSGGNASQLGSESTLPVASRHEGALR